MTDPIADLLTRIRNSYMAHRETVSIPYSTQKAKIAEVLVSHNYAESVETVGEGIEKQLVIKLKYVGRSPVLTHIERISTPGRRVYSAAKDVKPVLGGNGIRIVSTSKGIMVDTDAKVQHLGGEVICKVW